MALYLLFSLTALIFSSVGFGGGSTYTALLVFFGTDYTIIPLISLVCNIIVVSGGVFHFVKSNNLDLKQAFFLVIPSVPLAFVGGYLSIDEDIFLLTLSVSLFLSGIALVLHREKIIRDSFYFVKYRKLSLFFVSGILGFLAGVTGIGGGIFLAPVLHFIRWDNSRKIAAVSSFFILFNSFFGLFGQFLKHYKSDITLTLEPYIPLPVFVFFSGQLGSILCSRTIKPSLIKRITGGVILLVSIRLLFSHAF